MHDATELSCREFAAVLASSEPTPGGGGAAALVGALAASLSAMVTALTIGRKKYADVEGEMLALQKTCGDLRLTLLDLVKGDAEGFAPLAAAYGIPKDDPTRAETLENATLTACEAPLAMMEACCKVIECAEIAAEKGTKMATSDAACSASLAVGALQSASLNIYINTKSLQDRAAAEALNAKANAMLETYVPRGQAVFAAVRAGYLG